jgi:hypothetical protein
MNSAFTKLAANIAARNSNVNQLASEEALRHTVGLAGMAGGYELKRLMHEHVPGLRSYYYRPYLASTPIGILGSLGSNLGSSIAKSGLSNNQKALISAGGLGLGVLGIGRLGNDLIKAFK